MPTPNKESVEKMIRELQKALSENDIEFLVRMAQEDDEEKAEKDEK
jgi:hypothetical protein